MMHSQEFLKFVAETALCLQPEAIERMVRELVALREREGRLFLLGVGGSAGNCSHAVNDFRKLAGLEAYSPCDNVSEITARTNDEGWETVFAAWLKTSRANAKDAVLVMSVGGGDAVRKVSANIVFGLQEAKRRGLKIFGIVGRDGGYTKQIGDEVIVVPTVNKELVTPIAEAFQGIVWHALVSHPLMKVQACKWESVTPAA